jgi:hypothetical protein
VLSDDRTTVSDAQELVQAALQAEVDATFTSRAELLEQALARDPNHAPARWQSGFVQRDGKWSPYIAGETQVELSSVVRQYWAQRSRSAHTSQDQLALANWCRRHKLFEQERAHLVAALELAVDPNDARLRSRLGFERVGTRWIDRQQAKRAAQQAREQLQAFQRWRSKLEPISTGLASSNAQTRDAAEARLREIDDPSALPAMEAVLSAQDMATAHLLLDVYANMPSHRSAAALARQAAFSPWVTVRQSAAVKLRARPPEQYAPELISLLETPIESRLDVYVRNSTLSLTQTFMRETYGAQQVAVVESATPLNTVPLGFRPSFIDVGERLSRYSLLIAEISAMFDDDGTSPSQRSQQVDAHNAATDQLNDRVCAALSAATGIDLPAQPNRWWQWWQDYNDLYPADEKPIESTYRREEEDSVAMVVTARQSSSCLAAGTTVWTDRGPVPIETVQVGDLALAKHPETGELAYKPVLRTTVRPSGALLNVTVGGESFLATGGHTFWVSGQGWLKIRDVEPGMQFHGATEPAALERLEPAAGEPVYNVVVADFHTYFVGASMILSHDPTFAEPTDTLVPGLGARD